MNPRDVAIGAVAMAMVAIIGLFVDLDKHTRDAIGFPPASTPAAAPADSHPFCHDGWKATRLEADHVVSLTCERDGVTVILDKDGRFNIAEQGGRFITNENQVPGW